MKKLLHRILSKKEDPNFLALEIGLESVTAATFAPQKDSAPRLLGMSRKLGLTADNLPDLISQALDSLAFIVTPLPTKVLVGVTGAGVKTATVVAKYQRPEPTKTITDEELAQVLEKSTTQVHFDTKDGSPNLKHFFSSVLWGHVDGARIVNPIGSKGEEVEVSCFHAYKDGGELDLIDKTLTDLNLSIKKVVPTAFALSRIIIRNGIHSLIILRVSEKLTEATFIADHNVAEIVSFNLGFNSHTIWGSALAVLMEEVKLPKGIPDSIWIYPEGKEESGERIRTALSEINWKKDFKREIPNIRIGQKPEGFGIEETPLLALSLEGI